ncbi:hypothetical protein HYFRA_00001906 [Hymenoscyphus fraxineus]|uniref:Heterokaryon incompatibility domain-containing protein n=1 Tax=Hymenoscyphus fraxineus TaxID=746836 RepID=A0A9N9PE78_9HELO|nr:hypothetical protein HYFRA_00001906 [Hymenoscyphus fraxineus]
MAIPRVPHRYNYSYEPLKSPREFRLIRFRDFLHGEDCSLHIFDIDDPERPTFSAFSYTWGAPLSTSKSKDDYGPDSSKILILDTESGPKQIGVLKNLYEGLVQLTKSNRPEWLWVDAICINQEDDEERCLQVTLMGAVYSYCQQVIIWLGKDESDLKDFKFLHETFLPILWEYGQANNLDAILKSKWTLDDIKKKLKLDTEKYWKGYAKFYDERRWFSRAWVLQELTLAQKVVVLAGKSRLDWDDMSTLANIISLNGLGLLLQKSLPQSKRGSRQIIGFECLRLHTFRQLYHQLATPESFTPSSRSSTWKSVESTDSTISTTSTTESVSSSTISELIPKKGRKLARSLREQSKTHIPQITKVFASSRSPRLNSWGSVKNWSTAMRSKFSYVYSSGLSGRRADATGFSQWTTALIDNLIPNDNPRDRWNTVFLCCVQWVRYFEATKLHDKIYGILGSKQDPFPLLSHSIIDMLRPAHIPPPIYPDYNNCVQDRHARQLKSLPSWVPDFASLSNEDLSFTSTANWNASRAGIVQSYPRKIVESTLELRGSCFDVIDDTVAVFAPPNWAGDGSRLPDGSIMSVHILGHFEKIIRFACETKPWPYKVSRLEVLVATLVAGQLSAISLKDTGESHDEEQNSYFPSFLPASPKQLPTDEDTGLGIDLTSLSLSPEWKASPHRRGTSDVSPISPSENQLTRPKSTSLGNSSTIVASPEPLAQEFSSETRPRKSFPPTPKHKHSLNAIERFPYAKGVFQFRIWVFCMLIAGSFSEETEPMVDSCLGAISQLSFLCPPEIGHLPTRAEVAAASGSAKGNKTMQTMFQGIEGATGVGDFADGQFSEFDVRWSKTQGSQKMYRTKRGYYGMGPVSLEKGDQVWVICDARVPFVLRPSVAVEGAFELIGETYLHGCMHGEMMTPDQLESIGPVSLV